MPNVFVEQGEAVAESVERLKRHLADFAADTPNNRPGPARAAREEIEALRRRLDKLHYMLSKDKSKRKG